LRFTPEDLWECEPESCKCRGGAPHGRRLAPKFMLPCLRFKYKFWLAWARAWGDESVGERC
jgi:hypothetical protein